MRYLEEAASPQLVSLNAGPLSWSNWNLEMLVFQEGGKPEYPEKNQQSKTRTDNELNPHNFKVNIGCDGPSHDWFCFLLFLDLVMLLEAVQVKIPFKVEDSIVFCHRQKIIDVNSVISAGELIFHKELLHRRFT